MKHNMRFYQSETLYYDVNNSEKLSLYEIFLGH